MEGAAASVRDREDIGYRYFFLSFSAAFFVLSVLFLFLMTTVHPKTPESLGVVRQQEKELYLPTSQDCMTVLLIGYKTGRTQANSFVLARFDPVRGKVPLVVLPPQTLVQNGDKTETLRQVYEYGGADYARNALARTLGVPVHRYVRIHTDAFVACADAVGTVEFALPGDLTVQSGGVSAVLRAGTQLLDGQRVLAVVESGGAEQGELARCHLAGELAAAIVNQRIDVVQSTLVDKVFETVINLIDTDISYPDYDNCKAAAELLAQLSRNPAYSLPAAGEMEQNGERFALGDTFVAQVRQSFA